MTTPFLFAALLASAQALPKPATVIHGYTTSSNGPTTEEPCIREELLGNASELQLYSCNVASKPANVLAARQEALDENSEEYVKVSGMDRTDACNLFEVLKCGDVEGDMLAFSDGACLSNGQLFYMDMCLPLFLGLSKEEQDQKLAEIGGVREEQEEKQEEGVQEWEEEMEPIRKEKEEREKKEQKEREEREKKEQQEIEEWKKENPIFVKESGASNTVVTLGDTKVPFGSLKPWDLISKIPELCSGQACKAGGNSFPFDTVVYTPKQYENEYKEARHGQLVMTIEGSWDAAQELGSRDQLLTAVKATLDGLNNNGLIEHKDEDRYLIGPCKTNPRTQGADCSEKENGLNKRYEVEQWSTTDAIQIRITNGPAGEKTLAGFISIGFELKMPEAESTIGYCGGVIGAGAGIAGMFAAPAGPAVAAGLLIGAVFCNLGS